MKKDIWQKFLNTDEKAVYEFSIAKNFVFLIQAIIFILVILVSFLNYWPYIFFLVIIPLLSWFFRITNVYCLTEKRILVFRGFLTTNLISVDYGKITDISITEPFWEKILCSSGQVAINTAGYDAPEIILQHISQPHGLKKRIDELRQKLG